MKVDCQLDAYLTDLSELLVKAENHDLLRELFIRYGFKTWLKEYVDDQLSQTEIDTSQPASAPQSAISLTAETLATNYECVTTIEQLSLWLQKIQESTLTCIDTETNGLEPMRSEMVGISLAVEPGQACYIPFQHSTAEQQLNREQVFAYLKPWLEDAQAKKVGQNLKFDQHIFANHGVRLAGIMHDTILQSYVYESHKPHNMDNLALRHLGIKTISYEEVCGKGVSQITFDQVNLAQATQYAAEDADITLRLHQYLWPLIEKDEKLRFVYEQLELPTMRVLGIMETNGILIDTQKLAQQGQVVGRRMLELATEIFALAGQPFNIQSPKQIGEILFTIQKLPVIKKTPGGAPSTDEEVLQKLSEDYPLPARILDYRSLAKLQSTYIEKLPKMMNPGTGRVHTNYAQSVAATGRLASNEPNLQNIPIRTQEGRKIREAFIARSGCKLLSADYSQIELRIVAAISGDANMCQAFKEGKDIHTATAARVYNIAESDVTKEMRYKAKSVNFGIIYGQGAFGLADNLGISRSEAKEIIANYKREFPGIQQYMDDTIRFAKEKGYVETLLGRKRWLRDINSSNFTVRGFAERNAINSPIQGTAADMIKLAMQKVYRAIQEAGLKSKMILQVHDELIFDALKSEAAVLKPLIISSMQEALNLPNDVPVIAECGQGDNWLEAH